MRIKPECLNLSIKVYAVLVEQVVLEKCHRSKVRQEPYLRVTKDAKPVRWILARMRQYQLLEPLEAFLCCAHLGGSCVKCCCCAAHHSQHLFHDCKEYSSLSRS